jgi:integrase
MTGDHHGQAAGMASLLVRTVDEILGTHRFSRVTRRAGIGHWHAHEGRRTAVSIMSSNGVPIQDIADTVGHKSTHVTETVYRHVIAPAIRGGASVMDDVFGDDPAATDQA